MFRRLRSRGAEVESQQVVEIEEDSHKFRMVIEDLQELYRVLGPGLVRYPHQVFQFGYGCLEGLVDEVGIFASTTGQETLFAAEMSGGNLAPDGSNVFVPYSVEHFSQRLKKAGLRTRVWETPDEITILSRNINVSWETDDSIPSTLFEVRNSLRSSGPVLTINSIRSYWRSDWAKGRFENPEQFERYVEAFTVSVEALVEAIYIEADQEVPEVSLDLRRQPIDDEVALVSIGEKRLRPLTEAEVHDVTFDEVGGQREAVETMRQIAAFLKDPESFRSWGSDLASGVLLVGPPGNGKTLIAKATAHESSAHFIVVNIADILNWYVGVAEDRLRRLFGEARKRDGVTIILFDELDALGGARKADSREWARNIVDALNQEMGGFEENENILVLGTTNRVEDVDPALRREGRFDIHVDVDLPDLEGRQEVLEIHVRKAYAKAGRELFADLDLEVIAQRTEGASGARLTEIVRRVTWEKGVEEARLRSLGQAAELPLITTAEFLEVIEAYEER